MFGFYTLQWVVELTHQAVRDTLLDYGRIEGQQTLTDLEKALDIAHQDVLKKLIYCWVSKVLL